MSKHDVIFVGGGFNALVCASYLARAGKSVLILEQRERVGGLVGTEEFAPGFRASVCFQSAELLHPTVLSDLELDRYGLRLLSGGGTLVPDGDRESRYFAGSGTGIEGILDADRAGFRELASLIEATGKALEPLMTSPLPDIERRGLGDLIELLKAGWRLRKLGDPKGLEVMRMIPMSVKDVLDERISDDATRAALAGPALLGSWLAPRSPGSALGLVYQRPGWIDGLFPGVAHVKGGMGGLAEALEESAVAQGVEIRKGNGVQKIESAGTRVTGVKMCDGDEHTAPTIISGVDPRTTLLDLADASELDPELAFATRGIRSRGSVAIVRYALDSLPTFGSASEKLTGRIQLGADLDTLERAFDPIKYGKVPESPWAEVYLPTTVDRTLAPEGKHVLTAWVQSIPGPMGCGETDIADEVREATTRLLETHSPGFSNSIIHSHVRTPREIERDFGITDGCVYHVEPAMDQMLYLRPMPGWYAYRTPFRGLYLCGAGNHPGSGLSGLAGKNCARQVLSDGKR